MLKWWRNNNARSALRSYDDGQGRKDDQGRADRQRDPPPSLAARDADRPQAQQDRPRYRAAGHACGSRHDREGSTPRPRRRREISSRYPEAAAGSGPGDDNHRPSRLGLRPTPAITAVTRGRWNERRKRTMKLSDIADNAGSRKKRMRVGRGIGSGK